MDDSEKLVEAHLRRLGYADVVHEPDGNITPDFLVNRRIAIEVRRLNQNYDDGTGSKGLEETDIPLRVAVRRVLLKFGAATTGQSWFVYYRFSRPLPTWKALPSKIEGTLRTFLSNGNSQPFERDLGNGFHLKVFKAQKSYKTLFVLGGYSDRQSGGWLIEEMQKNLNYCINEKAQKIAKFRSRYKTWWLVLTDHIGYGLDDFDRDQFRKNVNLPTHPFNKIILLDPNDCTHALEVYSCPDPGWWAALRRKICCCPWG
jgi:hypothetical protein